MIQLSVKEWWLPYSTFYFTFYRENFLLRKKKKKKIKKHFKICPLYTYKRDILPVVLFDDKNFFRDNSSRKNINKNLIVHTYILFHRFPTINKISL